MSTLEKAMGLLQEMPENKLEAVYMYIRFVNSQTDSDETIPAKKSSMENEEFEKAKAMLRLMCELNEGRRSGEEDGYVPSGDVRAYFHGKRP